MQKFSEGGDRYQNPLIVQSDRTILLDVHAPLADECRNALIPFAELERSPEHLHTYRLTPLSLWNATSAGIKSDSILETLDAYSRYDVPQNVGAWIKETAERFGKLKLVPAPAQENAQNAAPASRADEQVDGAQDYVPAKKEPYVFLTEKQLRSGRAHRFSLLSLHSVRSYFSCTEADITGSFITSTAGWLSFIPS